MGRALPGIPTRPGLPVSPFSPKVKSHCLVSHIDTVIWFTQYVFISTYSNISPSTIPGGPSWPGSPGSPVSPGSPGSP